MFHNITIKQKVYFLALFGAVISILIASGSLYSINAIGKQLKQIAEENIPLTNAITQITTHQLEQAVMFERAARYAEIMDNNANAYKHYKESKAKFLKYAHKVDKEILEAEEQMQHIIEHEINHGGSAEIIEEFQHVLAILKKIEKEHASFDHHVEQVFTLFEQGRTHEAEKLAEKVEKEENKLDHELEALLNELQEFTAESALHAEHFEQKVMQILTVVSIAAAVIFLIVAFFIVRGIIGPLLATRGYADTLSSGNLDADAPSHNFKDEIADIMNSLSVFKENALETRQLREQQKEQEILAEQTQKKVMRDMADSFDGQVGGVIGALAAASTELQASAESMRVIADETSEASTNVAASSEEASANVNTVASAMEEMSASSGEIAGQVTNAQAKSNDTTSNAENASATVGNLNQLVENIGEVVVAIQDIAEQTNLLALNATIEAARAGDAGKGFAVVADEVKKLATETGQKTEEINTRINEIQNATRESVEAMERILGNISEIDHSVTSVSAAVEEQNATTTEIVRSVSEASQGVQDVSQIIQDVQRGAGETGSSADAVLSAAKEVAGLSDNLKGSVEQFLERIREDNQDSGQPTASNKVEAENEAEVDEESIAAE